MNKVEKAHYEAYKREALTWETGTVLRLKKSARTAWWVASAGVIVGVLGMASATLQATQEAPMPLVLRVDNSTGIIDRVDSLREGKITTSEATDKYFAQLYVQYRESWNEELAKENFYRAALMSTPAEQQRYEALYRRSPLSPMKVYAENAKVHIDIKGTSFIQPGVASVRYIRVVERIGGAQEMTHHTATVTFTYSSGRMSEKDRAINPLGFQAEYRTDPDAPDVAPIVVTAPAAPIAASQAVVRVAQTAQERAPLDLRPLQAKGK